LKADLTIAAKLLDNSEALERARKIPLAVSSIADEPESTGGQEEA
jgi:hypothetical protein